VEYITSTGRLIDVSGTRDRELEVSDIPAPIGRDEFVIFRTNNVIDIGYGGTD
jgi:hypothetical protein